MLDHVALVVVAIEESLGRLAPLALPVGSIETFPAEGKREVYVGAEDASARLLLMQPLGAVGPYARALERRGPGLHHVALRVADVEAALGDLPGWLLHPRSLYTIQRSRTAWLARPGIATLVELVEAPRDLGGTPLVERLEIAARHELAPLLARVARVAGRLPPIAPSPQGGSWVTLAGQRIALEWLAGSVGTASPSG